VLLLHEANLASSTTSLQVSLDTLNQQLLEASAQRDGLKAELSRKEDELSRLRAHVQEVRGSQRSLLDAELRQGRLNVLKALIDATERVRELAAVESQGEALLRGLHGDMVRHLEGFGISVVGDVGGRRPFDAKLDTVLGVAAETVEVVSPSYVAGAGADITVLRRSSVRGVDEREGN
jgi:molecular chaperone GrpE (heat shock protein)